MKVSDIIKLLSLGAFVGCFIVFFIFVLLSFGNPQIVFSSVDIINAFFGSILIGWGFSLSALIYRKEDLGFPLQIIIQMLIGFTILFAIAIYLKWIPVNLGLGPIIVWFVIACIFAGITWGCFYLYYYLMARELNNKLNK